MAQIQAFQATRYSDALRADYPALLTPPYDVIDAAYQDDLYSRHAKNLVRVDFGKQEASDNGSANKYSRAAETFDQWKLEGTLARDAQPALYIYEQEFDLPGRGRCKRRGFFCEVQLEGLEGEIRAHERTFDGPKADRLLLTRATQANLSPIFCVYEDPEKVSDAVIANAINGSPDSEFEIDGIIHRLWVVDDADACAGVAKALADKRLFIADGHHRYETAVNYRNERREEGPEADGTNAEAANWALMFLANTHDEGLEVLPTHRVLSKELTAGIDLGRVVETLKENFHITELTPGADASASAETYLKALAEAGERGASFVLMVHGGPPRLLTLRAEAEVEQLIPNPDIHAQVKELDVTIVHRHLIERVWLGEGAPEPDHDDILYVKDAGEAVGMIESGEAEAGFLLNATKIEQVCRIASLGARMPQKSTYFYPKIITGLVIRDMTPGA